MSAYVQQKLDFFTTVEIPKKIKDEKEKKTNKNLTNIDFYKIINQKLEEKIISEKTMIQLVHEIIDFYVPKMNPLFSRKLRRILVIHIGRAKQTFGSCKMFKSRDNDCELKFTKYLFFKGNAKNIVNTVIHELTHAFLPFKERHGFLFKRSCSLIKRELDIVIERTGDADKVLLPENKYKYKVVCTCCKREVFYYKASKIVKNPKTMICLHCNVSSFKVYKL